MKSPLRYRVSGHHGCRPDWSESFDGSRTASFDDGCSKLTGVEISNQSRSLNTWYGRVEGHIDITKRWLPMTLKERLFHRICALICIIGTLICVLRTKFGGQSETFWPWRVANRRLRCCMTFYSASRAPHCDSLGILWNPLESFQDPFKILSRSFQYPFDILSRSLPHFAMFTSVFNRTLRHSLKWHSIQLLTAD